jgi:CDP-paratose 2-epimerase
MNRQQPQNPRMHKNVLITGGAGFVGASIAVALKTRFPRMTVVALDNLHRRGSELNFPRLRAAGVDFVHGDVRNPEDLDSIRPPELIIECSAEPSAQAGYVSSPEYLIQTNLFGCFRCLELARRTKADFLFLSTSRVYPWTALNELAYDEGETRFILCDHQSLPGASADGITEDFPLYGARSLYGMTKLSAELMIAEYAVAYGFRFAINRCGVIAGPWQMGKVDQGVATLWIAAHYFRKPLSYIGFGGRGKQVRDLVHIDDLCDLIFDQVTSFDRYHGKLFNVGGGRECSLSLREMTGLCERIAGSRIPISASAENRPADVRIFLSDCRRLTNFSGWRPRRDATSILLDTWNWIRAEESVVRSALGG